MDSKTYTLRASEKTLLASLRFLLACIALIPFRLRSLIGFGLGLVFSLVPTKDRKIASLHLRLFFPNRNVALMLGVVYARIGQVFLESLDLSAPIKNPGKFIHAPGWEKAQNLLSQNKGLIVLSAHTGNWDLIAAYAIMRGVTLYTAAREARNIVLHILLADLREKYGVRILWRSDEAAIKQILRALKENSAVSALIDQDTKVSGRMISFFGIPAFTPTGLAEIARRNKTPVVGAFILRRGLFKFEICVEEIPHTDSAEAMVQEFNMRLEKHLRESPLQWVWFHKRWRTLEDGRTLSSKEYISYLEGLIKK